MNYDSTRPLPKAPRKADVTKVRAALRSDIMRVERWLEVCPDEDMAKSEANLEHLKKALRGLQG